MSEKFEVFRENQHKYIYCDELNSKHVPEPLHPRNALTDYKNRNIVSLKSLTTGKKTQIQFYRKTQEIRKRLDYENDDKENILITKEIEYIRNDDNHKERDQRASGKYPPKSYIKEVATKSVQTVKTRPSCGKVQKDERIYGTEKKNENQRPTQKKVQVKTTNEHCKQQPQIEKNVPQSVRVPQPPSPLPVIKRPTNIIPKPSNICERTIKPQYLSAPPKNSHIKPILKCANTGEGIKKVSSEKKISFRDQLLDEVDNDQKKDEKINTITRVYKVDMRHVTVRRGIDDHDDYNDELLWTQSDNADATWIENESEKLKFLNKRKFTESIQPSYDGYGVDKLFYPYIEDVVTYLRRLEYKYVIRISLFSNRPENGSPHTRMLAINLMLRLTDFKRLSLSTFLRSVILFDNVLHTKLFSPNKQILVGLVCLWLSIKNDYGTVLKASDIVSIINNKYTVKEILDMEMAILTYFKGDFNFPDPTDFVAYIIHKWLGFESTVFNHLLNYFLICFSMHSGFSTISPSHQAAAVVHLTSQFFTKNPDIMPWKSLSESACYYSEIELKNIQLVMYKQLKKFTTPDSVFYPYTMYSTSDKLKLSILLAKKLEKCTN